MQVGHMSWGVGFFALRVAELGMSPSVIAASFIHPRGPGQADGSHVWRFEPFGVSRIEAPADAAYAAA